MHRRGVLAAVAASVALAGCVSDEPAPGRGDDGADANDDGDDRTDSGDDEPADSEDDADGSEPDADGGTVLERVGGEPARPECERESETVTVEHDGETVEYETAPTVPYPEPPTTFAEDDVVAFVDAFEEAYVTHDVLCNGPAGHVLRVGYDAQEREPFDWDEDVTVVFLLRAGGATHGLDADGHEWMADLGYDGVVYAVDETGAARVPFDDAHELEPDEFESHAPDPLEEGTLVAAFD